MSNLKKISLVCPQHRSGYLKPNFYLAQPKSLTNAGFLMNFQIRGTSLLGYQLCQKKKKKTSLNIPKNP